MKLNLTTASLQKALGRLSSVPGLASQQLATQIVVIEADDFSSKLRRTTANASISIELEAAVDEPGVCAVGYDTLVSAANAMAGQDTTLQGDDKDLLLLCGKTKARLHAFPEGDYLAAPAEQKGKSDISFLSSDLLRWIGVAGPGASTNAGEAKFAGLCLRVQGGATTLFGIDRRRCHMVEIGAAREPFNRDGGAEDDGLLLPNDSIAALRKLLPEGESRVDISVHGGSFRAKVGEVDALLPLGAEQPPSITGFLPPKKQAPLMASCNRAEFLRAVRTASPLGFQDSKVISVKIGKDTVEVVGDTQSGAMVGHEIDAQVTGEPKHLRAVGQYLVDMVESCVGETIEINYTEAKHMIYTYADDRLIMLMLVRDGVAS